jgi:hypothetical protein
MYVFRLLGHSLHEAPAINTLNLHEFPMTDHLYSHRTVWKRAMWNSIVRYGCCYFKHFFIIIICVLRSENVQILCFYMVTNYFTALFRIDWLSIEACNYNKQQKLIHSARI